MPTWYKSKNFWVIIAAIIAIIAAYKFCETSASTKQRIPVTIAPVIEKDIVPHVEAVGSVVAENTAAITSQVTGQLINIPANPGQEVKAGDLLFVIDPRPFQASVDQAKATLVKDQAAAENATSDLARYQKLIKQGYISKEFYEQTKSNAQSAKAQVAADQAALANAQVQLSYTQIRAPISGRLSDIAPNPGEVVTANGTTPLTTINQFSPMDVSFSIPAATLPSILAAQKISPVTITAIPDANKNVQAKGQIFFVDNQINESTGTIIMKARFPNLDETLWPGAFVHVSLNLPLIPHALLAPTIALQQGQQQQYYVYTVDQKEHAHQRKVTIGTTEGDMTQITSGLQAGEHVVTQGQFQIGEGSHVKVE